MAFKNATKGYLNGVTVGAGDVDTGVISNAHLAGSITSDKLSKPYAIAYINLEQATPAAETGLFFATLSQAGSIMYAQAGYKTAPSSGTTTVDVHVGGTYGSHHSIFGSGSKLAPGLTSLKSTIAQPSGTLGNFSAGGYLRIDVDAVGSGTKADLYVTLAVKQLLQS